MNDFDQQYEETRREVNGAMKVAAASCVVSGITFLCFLGGLIYIICRLVAKAV